MNITFMVGNGFDLGAGLKCRCADYYLAYAKNTRYMPKELEPRRLQEAIRENAANWADYEKILGGYSRRVKTAEEYLFHDREFRSCLRKYLRDEEKKLDFTAPGVKERIERDIKYAVEFCWSAKRIGRNRRDKLLRNAGGDQIRCSFLSFGYTSVLQKCLDMIPGRQFIRGTRKFVLEEVRHVHGNLHPGDGTAPLIMGVNDPAQIENPQFRANKDVCGRLVKPACISGKNRDRYCKTIRDSDLVCIYGMSLGETDGFWWDEVGQWLRRKPDALALVYYYDAALAGLDPDSSGWAGTEETLRERLIPSDADPREAEDMRGRIRVFINDQIFRMDIPYRADAVRSARK